MCAVCASLRAWCSHGCFGARFGNNTSTYPQLRVGCAGKGQTRVEDLLGASCLVCMPRARQAVVYQDWLPLSVQEEADIIAARRIASSVFEELSCIHFRGFQQNLHTATGLDARFGGR